MIFTRATLASYSAGISCRRVSVCPSVTSRCSVLKRLNVGSRKQRHTIARGFQFAAAENIGKTQTGSPLTETSNAGGVG